MCEGGNDQNANDDICPTNIDAFVLCFIFWNRIHIKYATQNVVDYGNYLSYRFNPNC